MGGAENLAIRLPDGTLKAIRGRLTLGRKDLGGDLPASVTHLVSGQHATFSVSQGEVFVEDGVPGQPSSNGTALNGAPIARAGPKRLQAGDRILLAGAVELQVVLAEPAVKGSHEQMESTGPHPEASAKPDSKPLRSQGPGRLPSGIDFVLPNGTRLAVGHGRTIGRREVVEGLKGEDRSKISLRHLNVQEEGGRFSVEDGAEGKPSTNGTVLGGQQIRGAGRQPLAVGDRLVLGGIVELLVGAHPFEDTGASSTAVQQAVPLVAAGLRPSKEPELSAADRLRRRVLTLRQQDPEPVQRGMVRVFAAEHSVRPGFSGAWVSAADPPDSNLILEYTVEGTRVRLLEVQGELDNLYQIVPWEYGLPLPEMELLDRARSRLLESPPRIFRADRPEDVRKAVEELGTKLLRDVAEELGLLRELGKKDREEKLAQLAGVLAKYTAGYGTIETLMEDGRINDIYIDAPAPLNPVHVTLSGVSDPRSRGRCRTNITVGEDDAEALLARFRYDSGRPFSEGYPVLEHNIADPSIRVTVIGQPLSPGGLAMALRKHSTEPWTLLRLIERGSLTAGAAGLLSFLIDGRSTFLVAGSRGAGKTSLLGAMMLEMPPSQRILTIEDTPELPVRPMQALGYKVQSMVVGSAVGGTSQITANQALRVSLRLGESAIILGEVRGEEARTLYEAMRAGTAGSTVMGTFHADSAQGVFRRVTSDLGIPPASFSATDVVVVAGLRRPGGGVREVRRITQIAEVLKADDAAGQFQDLMAYDVDSDALIGGAGGSGHSPLVEKIARSWGLTVNEARRNIAARGAYRQLMVDAARSTGRAELRGARWVAKANSQFWRLTETMLAEGKFDADLALSRWKEWFARESAYD